MNFIILETGLGGRLDATNVVPKDIAVLAPIGLDHQQYLGDTLEEIAAEKAAIIAPGKPSVTAVQHPGVMAVIERTAQNRRSLPHDCPGGPENAHPIPARSPSAGKRSPGAGNHEAAPFPPLPIRSRRSPGQGTVARTVRTP